MDSMSIKFRTPTQSLGRNGVMKMAGIHISRHAGALYIAPITSKMQVGRAWMLVPLDMATDMAKGMLELSGIAQEKKAARRAA